ncbi:hypothetical protein GGX14DRAFT_369254 [Mycena pura]|uniref:Acyl-coenzyme A oxidase n=1 Tax=Mycena pura TaxID=153505 RepID=A0AAD6V6D3_9AGAR|nr:hypothetical protein GGX14DRAFT_369254 [Mycena pura]
MANRQIRLMNEARARASFDSRELTEFIYGGADVVAKREAEFARIEAALQTPGPDTLPPLYGEVPRTALFLDGLRVGKAMLAEKLAHKHTIFDRITPRYVMGNASPFGVHLIMFVPALKLLGSEEQSREWVPPAERCAILGAYAQTELGHGSAVRDLQTTATFDKDTDEFVLHTPTPTAAKYWPGGLAFSASHAVVLARLVIGPQDYGVHAFLAQLRSLDDWTPCRGVELGDLGMKLGHNSVDNGYAVFSHMRIPRANLLARHAQVRRDGAYVVLDAGARARALYGVMLCTRSALVGHIPLQLAQGGVIALRYSTVREQGRLPFAPAESPEVAIIEYRAQQHRLLSLMARAFALWFAGREAGAAYDATIDAAGGIDSPRLADLHATLAGLKAYATQTVADGVEEARRCCGGHGYSALGGFADLGPSAAAMATVEGDYWVMYQQTARWLLKRADAEGHRWLPRARLAPDADVRNPAIQLDVFRHRAVRLVAEHNASLRDAVQQGRSRAEAWNTHMVGLVSAARAHIEHTVLHAFVAAVGRAPPGPVRAVLTRLCSLFALTTIDGPHGLGFVEDGHVSGEHLRQVRKAVDELLVTLAPDAVALGDAWNFTDASLASALGCRDGDVYERMIRWTRQLPLNVEVAKTAGVFRPGFEEYIRPIIRGKL